MKKRVLSGIQPSGNLHIGNYFGMIKRMIEYQESSDLFCFIVNLHALTTVTDPKALKELTLEAAMDMLALGIDPEKSYFWAQSDVPETTELTWVLSCLTPFQTPIFLNFCFYFINKKRPTAMIRLSTSCYRVIRFVIAMVRFDSYT